jgi:predicted nucleic acid-binding protein
LRPSELKPAKRRIETLWAAMDRVGLTIEVARRAGDPAEQLGLRAYEAVHLAALEHVGDGDALLVAADEELLAAASALGYAIVRP